MERLWEFHMELMVGIGHDSIYATDLKSPG